MRFRTPFAIALITLSTNYLMSKRALAQTSSCSSVQSCMQVTNTSNAGGEAIVGIGRGTQTLGVMGESFATSGIGVFGGSGGGPIAGFRGVWGVITTGTNGNVDDGQSAAVFGENRLTGASVGVLGTTPPSGNGGVAVYGDAFNATNSWGAYFNGYVGASNNIYSSGDVFARGVMLTSDHRLKDDIRDVRVGLSELLKLRPITYRWKDKSVDRERHIGLVAQEVQEVIPSLVKLRKTPPSKSSDSLSDTLAIDYMGLVPVMIKAIQEQQKVISEQNARILALEKRKGPIASADPGNRPGASLAAQFVSYRDVRVAKKAQDDRRRPDKVTE